MPPKEWQAFKLGEVAGRRKERGVPALPIYAVTMDGMILRSDLGRRVISDLRPSEHLLARQGDLAYNMMRMWQGVASVAERDCLVSPAYVVCQLGPELLSAFTRHLIGFPSLVRQFELFSRGLTADRLRLYYDDFAKVDVVLPPRPEQEQIARILDTIDEAIRKTEEIIAKLEQVKQGLLHDLLTRGIDENGELRDPVRYPEQFKDSPLGRIPKEWNIALLGQVAEIRSGIAKNSKRSVRDPIRVPYLRVANVQDGFLDLAEMAEIEISQSDLDRYRVLPGDVLMNEGGDLDKLGRGVVWDGQFDPCVHQNHVFVVRPGSEIMSAFLDAWTGAPPAKRYFLMAGKQTTNLASINKTSVARLPVALPPMIEQRTIMKRLANFDQKRELEKQSMTKLQLLKNGLMDDLLTGKVRVTPLLDEIESETEEAKT